MNTSNQDKFEAHRRTDRSLSSSLVEASPHQRDLEQRQASYIHRRFGIRADRARLVAGLAFKEARP